MSRVRNCTERLAPPLSEEEATALVLPHYIAAAREDPALLRKWTEEVIISGGWRDRVQPE
jgi:hypothetical protein